MERYFFLARSEALKKWGDYGSILLNGMACDVYAEQTRLKRTGPFVPPFSFPLFGGVVVTDAVKNTLESGNLRGVGDFRPVTLEKAVSVNWQDWNRHEKISSSKIPRSGEPEDYILAGQHDPELATAMGRLWTWHPLRVGSIDRTSSPLRILGIRNSISDVLRLNDNGARDIIVNSHGRQFLLNIAGDWVSFDEIPYEIS
ncbi:MAG: hypothetical protein ACK6DS_20390 [Planctomycetota bacterium]